MRADALFTFPVSMPFSDFFDGSVAPWEWVSRIAAALDAFDFQNAEESLRPQSIPSGVSIGERVYLHRTVQLPPVCVIEGPAWIGPNVQIRPNAFIRSHVIAGPGTVLGHCCEYKNCLLLENVETPHYNYVGDSVLGNGAHLGAGAICANLKLSRDEIRVRLPEAGLQGSGLRKLGALLGDGAETGCNCVLQPGTILGKKSVVLGPSFHGTLAAGKMAIARIQTGVIDRPE